ncbi:TadE/TadG family type IV pilus assembly protein [Kitasatospora sp. CM 4170]|uniref:TadE/TadG family type IV pilus assembly protein n=1 Tax=Kitasatospora aburaviensis TaxID=67265 RepID=A0ABW1ENU4_9ACTN|nr:TadE/TadG family type IV pilus assembly protein [Kitasatospora sp. CM 4170]WNM48694.1 TadE/TadG family type IV pilus assembly protein [Kitasatospora sp. CM 4170]
MSLSLAIVFPVVLVLILLAVDVSMWWYYRQVALTAAREGVDAGRVQGNQRDEVKDAAAKLQAEDFLARQDVRGYDVRTDGSSPVLVRVTVKLTAPSVVPFLNPTVVQSAEAPRERFVPPRAAP